jgi:subtilisin family serine protease
VGAAGNNSVTNKFYPAAYPGVISVAGSTDLDLRYSFSNYSSSWVDVAAPGCTYSTHRGSDYGDFCGTSAATPVVSGIAALVESARPSLSRSQIESILQSATVRTPFEFTRFGRIDAYKAVHRAVHGTWPRTPPLLPSAPLLDPAAEVTFKSGSHAGYRFESSGAILRGAALTLDATTTAHTSKQGTIPGRTGYWFYMVDGSLAGFWVAESSAVKLTPQPTPTPTPTPSPSPTPAPTP